MISYALFFIGYSAGLTAVVLTAIATKDGYASKHQLLFLLIFLALILSVSLLQLFPSNEQLLMLTNLMVVPCAISIPATVNRSRPSEGGTFFMKILYGIVPGLLITVGMFPQHIYEPMILFYLVVCVSVATILMKMAPPAKSSPMILGKWIVISTVVLVPLIFIVDLYRLPILKEQLPSGEFFVLPLFYGILNTLFIVDLMKRFSIRFHHQKHEIDLGKIPLSEREKDVANLLVQGFTYASIGKTLSISHSTVKTHCSHIYSKLKIENRAELSLFFIDKKQVELVTVLEE